jgi:hypothetical protein
MDAIGTWTLDDRSLRVLRYAVGATIAMAVAMAFNYQLAFLTPLLALSFLAAPGPRPTLKAGVGFIAIVAASCLSGLLLGRYLISYPLVYIPFTALVLLRLFYLKAAGKAPAVMTMLLISLLVIPLIVMSSPQVAQMAAVGVLLAAVVTIGVVWLVHGLIPESGHRQPAAVAAPPDLAPMEQFRTAAISTLVLFPVFVLFYAFQMMDLLVILVFVAILSSQPGFATNFKMGAALIVGNVIGGLSAILFYELLVMVPEFAFLIVLTLLAGLVFGTRVFTDKPIAKLFGMAYSTLLLVIGSVTASGTDEASYMVYMRVLQISIAVVYVFLASGVADRFIRRREA